MTNDSEFKIARKYAFRLLSLRNYHSAVLLRKLKGKGFAPGVCGKVIEDCIRLDFLKDDSAILSVFRRGYGPRYIAFKLQIDLQEVRCVITKEMQKEKMQELTPKLKTREKAMQTFQRKGFDLELIIEIFS